MNDITFEERNTGNYITENTAVNSQPVHARTIDLHPTHIHLIHRNTLSADSFEPNIPSPKPVVFHLIPPGPK